MTTSRRTHLRTDRTYLTPLAHDQAWIGRILRGLQSGTWDTDRQADGRTARQTNIEDRALSTSRSVRSAPGYFTQVMNCFRGLVKYSSVDTPAPTTELISR